MMRTVYPAKPRKPEDLKCIFCAAPKTWKSALLIADESPNGQLYILYADRVCPPCRKKHTIQEFYDKIVEKRLGAAQESVKHE